MKTRVVVTGLGVITPIGNDVDSFWNGIKNKEVGIGPITCFDAADFKCRLAAEVKDFDPKAYMDNKTARRMERFSQFAVAAASQALAQSGLNMEQEDPFRVGVSIGSGIGSLQEIERGCKKLEEKGPSRVNPLMVPIMISNMAAGNVAIQYGMKGKCINVVTACATGTHSIGEAMRSIQYGEADVMLAGGTEAAITPIGIAGFSALTALCTNEDPKRASIPFDKDRSGFVMGEGAGVVVLESLEHAKARGAKILAEVVGYGATCDAYHITSPAEDGSGAARAMTDAIKDAGIAPEDIDYVNVHGTSTPAGDIPELKAVAGVLGDHVYNVNISSTKSMTGHLLGAAGAVEALACIFALTHGVVPPTINCENRDPEIDEKLNLTLNVAQKRDVKCALSNTFGFGGHNSTVIFRKL